MSNLILYKGIVIGQGDCIYYEVPGYADFEFKALKNISDLEIPLYNRMFNYLTENLETVEFESNWRISNLQSPGSDIHGYNPKLTDNKISFAPVSTCKEEDFIFFYKTRHPFSQWHSSEFEINGIVFSTAEQYMMFSKANLFENKSIADKILKTNDPRQQKELGRQVSNFDNDTWSKSAFKIVYEANYAKFTQNKNLRKFLLDTLDKTLVEASPSDTIWGIGLSETENKRFDRSQWKGSNWLGEVLICVREDIKNEIKLLPS